MPGVVDGRPGSGTSRTPKRVRSVTLACTLGDPPVVSGILETGRRCARNEISTRLCISDDEALLRGAALAEADQVVLDGHGYPDSALLGLFPLGSLLGGGLSFKAQVLMLGRRRPVHERDLAVHQGTPVFLGCKQEPRKTYGRHVFPPLLLALAPLIGSRSPETLKGVLLEELPKVIEKKPLLEDAEWTAAVLEPAPPRRRPRADDLRHPCRWPQTSTTTARYDRPVTTTNRNRDLPRSYFGAGITFGRRTPLRPSAPSRFDQVPTGVGPPSERTQGLVQ